MYYLFKSSFRLFSLIEQVNYLAKKHISYDLRLASRIESEIRVIPLSLAL